MFYFSVSPFPSRCLEGLPNDIQVCLLLCTVSCTAHNVGVHGSNRKSFHQTEMPSPGYILLPTPHQPWLSGESIQNPCSMVVSHWHGLHHHPSRVLILWPLTNFTSTLLVKRSSRSWAMSFLELNFAGIVRQWWSSSPSSFIGIY